MKTLVYITAFTPFGRGETFVLTEIMALNEMGLDMLIIPRDATNKLFHGGSSLASENTLSIPLFSLRILGVFLAFVFSHPLILLEIIKRLAFRARNVRIALKNLIILPKTICLSRVLRGRPVSHIHAHWASTTSTMAYIISELTGIPWSFTAHRWDITENNLLMEKCRTALFVRAISDRGKQEILNIIKDQSLSEKISVIHMGVPLPELGRDFMVKSDIFTLLCPANLVYVKGHKYLFEACKMLSDKGRSFRCLVAGEGPLLAELKRIVKNLHINEHVSFLGKLPHEKLLQLYAMREIDSVVLPSISTEDGQVEGVPVALMEAMSFLVPVISTDSGSISELIGDGSGIMVAEKDPDAIAAAVESLMNDSAYSESLAARGRLKIEKEYNEDLICRKLLSLYAGQADQDLSGLTDNEDRNYQTQ